MKKELISLLAKPFSRDIILERFKRLEFEQRIVWKYFYTSESGMLSFRFKITVNVDPAPGLLAQ